jgi:sugar phosphate isomerase/epimerase
MISLGVSTYSYWHFKGEPTPIEECMDHSASLGVVGVELLHRQMASEEPGYLNRLKRRAFLNGQSLICLSIHQDFVHPDPELRQQHVEHTIRCLRLAADLGIPCIRLNSGRWKTIASFDALMDARGSEPPLPGYTDDDAFSWCIESIERCLPVAEKYGVTMALENHWGLTRTPEGVLRVIAGVNSEWLVGLMDTGNFRENLYENLEKMASYVRFVQAKTYCGGGEWYTQEIDYSRVAQILQSVSFSGWVSLEMEGREDPKTAVETSIELLRDAFS